MKLGKATALPMKANRRILLSLNPVGVPTVADGMAWDNAVAGMGFTIGFAVQRIRLAQQAKANRFWEPVGSIDRSVPGCFSGYSSAIN
jgi:hypothetical protein